MENNGGYEYSGYIPSIPFGGEIGYYLYATDVSGNTANHPFIGSPDPHIFQVVSTEMQMEITHLENWNLVGLPLLVNNSEYFELFPSATENSCYSYTETGYSSETSLSAGNGYWLHFEETGTHSIVGEAISEISINMNSGWNLISGITYDINSYEIQDPQNIIIPNTLFEFQGASGYAYAQTLEPGKGYWIRTSGTGVIIISE